MKTMKNTKATEQEVGLKSIHEELYKDGKSLDEIIKKYPQLKEPLEQARISIEEQRDAAEQMYASGVHQDMRHYVEALGQLADRLQPALKILQTIDHSSVSKHLQEIGPLKFSIEVTPTIKSVSVSLQGVQSELKKLKVFRKKDVLFPSLITPQSQIALDMVETKQLTKQIWENQKGERPTAKPSVIKLVLYTDNYLCIKGIPKQEKCCLLRNRSGELPKRIEILRIYAAKKKERLSGDQLADAVGYKRAQTARDEFKRLFERIGHELGYEYEELVDGNDNGYSLKCEIELASTPAP